MKWDWSKVHQIPWHTRIQRNPIRQNFIQCLKSLRGHLAKQEPLLKWNEWHPARNLLFSELEAGLIPLDIKQMGPDEVWEKYSNTAEFKLRGMKFGDTFKRRLAALRTLVNRDKKRAGEDLQELLKAIQNHPPPINNHRGEPQWNGSRAQELLKEDVEAGEHTRKLPMELWGKRPEYKPYKKIFKDKIYQEVKTRKYLHTLKHDAEQKLRKNLKKLNLTDWGYGTPVTE